MQFDTSNPVVQLCAKGMQLEGEGRNEEAKETFYKAWETATTTFEQFTAAHYVARHQPTTADKLAWDEKCLQLAQSADDKSLQASYPSLYLNIAKCYEDMGNMEEAKKNYLSAQSYTSLLGDDGYGNMIRSGIQKGLQRVSA